MKKFLNSISFKLMLFALTVVIITTVILSGAVIYRENKSYRKNAARTTEFIAQTIGERILSLLMENEYQEVGKIVKAIMTNEQRIIAVRIRENTRLGMMNVLYVKTEEFAEEKFDKASVGFSEKFFHYNYQIKLGDELKGDIQIFFSLDEMYENIKSFNRLILFIFGGCLIIALVISTFITNLMVRPIKKFTISAQKIASGNLSEKIDIKNKDEIGDLAHSFEIMRQKIKEHIEMLDRKVIERTQAITDLLDNAGQGFLSFNEQLIIYKEYSKQCLELFGKPIENMNILELLFPDDWKKYKDNLAAIPKTLKLYLFYEGFNTVFLTNNPTIFRLLPQEFQFNNKILSFKYVLLTNNNIKKIMLIVTDITLEKKLEERAKFEEERNKFIVKVALDKKSFIIFIKDLNNILNKIRKNIEQNNIDAEKIKYIFRLVHTIKGNASFYNLTRVVSVAHTMEDYLYNLTHNHKEQVDINKLNNYLDDLYIAFNESLDIISDFLSKDEIFKDEKIFEVPESTLNNIIDVLARLNLFEKEKEFIIEKLQDIKKISIKHILKRFIVNAQQLAEHLGKQIEPIEISNEDLHIDYYSLRSVIDTFVHLIRNAVDHGIETPDIRKKSGKPAKGKVSILLNEIVLENKKYFVFEISDDGKGIDLEKIRQKLIDNNFDRNAVYQMSDYDLYMHIFDDGISTKTEVSEISGRGVGLSAVKEQVEKLGGQIKVHSQKNQGTTIKILLPTI